MSRFHAKAAKVYVDEFDFSGYSNTVDINVDNGIAEVTAFTDTDATFVEGKPSFKIPVRGFWSAADYDAEMYIDLTAASRRVGIYPAGGTAGNIGYEGQSDLGSKNDSSPIAGAIALDVEWEGTAPLTRSYMMLINTAVGASGNGTAYQLGAASAGQTLVGIIRLLASPAGAGNNTLDVIIQRDNDVGMGTPATALTFTQLTQVSTATFEIQTQAGAITDDWFRVNYTYAGVGSRTFSLVVTLGIRPT